MKRLYYHLGFSLLVTLAALWVVLTKPVNFGLDLKGGIEIILYPEVEKALKTQYEKYAQSLSELLEREGYPVVDYRADENGIVLELLEVPPKEKVTRLLREHFGDLFEFEVEGNLLKVRMTEKALKRFRETLISKTIEVLRKRVDSLGVAQAIVTKLGEKYVYIALPGVLDVEKAKAIVGKTAKLELLLVLDFGPDKERLLWEAKELKHAKVLPGEDGNWYLVQYPPVVTGDDLADAYPTTDEMGRPAVGFTLTPEAARRFAEFTEKNVGKPMAIVLDGRVVSAPVIRSRISDRGIITGHFTTEEVKNLVVVLKGGALPTDLKIEEIRVIGPMLGEAAIKQGIMAFVGGVILLTLILLWRYKVAGLTATLAVFHNALLLWAGLALLGATLTLPGIAGVILNMGIAVDSNVLIFERVKEELRKGAPLLRAIELGYRRALSAIVDAHVTLLVAALILSQFDAGPVKGFAVVLAIGTIASFFSNVYMSKVLLDFVARRRWLKFSI
ncbi:MAG: protein translocase subunit SecD [Aquificae bacterium]|nr:protein translocase subunit SecD [Aquificota bacterium]